MRFSNTKSPRRTTKTLKAGFLEGKFRRENTKMQEAGGDTYNRSRQTNRVAEHQRPLCNVYGNIRSITDRKIIGSISKNSARSYSI